MEASIEPRFQGPDGKPIFDGTHHLPALTGTGPEALKKFAAALDGVPGLSAAQKAAIITSMTVAAGYADYAEQHAPAATPPATDGTAGNGTPTLPPSVTTQANSDTPLGPVGHLLDLNNPMVKTGLKMIDGSPAIRGCLADMLDGLAKLCSDPQMGSFIAPLLQLIGINDPAKQLPQFAALLRSDKSFMPLVDAIASQLPAHAPAVGFTGTGAVPNGTGSAGTPIAGTTGTGGAGSPAAGATGTGGEAPTFVAVKSEGHGDISTAINTTIQGTGLKFSAAEIAEAERNLAQIPEQFRGQIVQSYVSGIQGAMKTSKGAPLTSNQLVQIATTAIQTTFKIDPKADTFSTVMGLTANGTLGDARAAQSAFTAIGGIIQTASTQAPQRQIASATPPGPSGQAGAGARLTLITSPQPVVENRAALPAAPAQPANDPTKTAAAGTGGGGTSFWDRLAAAPPVM
jgi:hypothetical protein